MSRKENEILLKGASVYAGFDPTASSLHLGNLLALISLLHFSIGGHQTIALVGGATGRIGDPSWRSMAKERLAESTVETNIAGLKKQIGGFFQRAQDYLANLRPNTQKIKQPLVVDNYEWYRGMELLRFLDQVGSNMRVSSLISRDSVKSRMQSEQGLSYSELTYQLLQAYDFYHLHRQYNCRLQIGGSDQWGNIVSGLDLISKLADSQEVEKVHGLTMPLLVTSSGEKMGKSAGNAKWLDPERTSPFELYQYFADMSDNDAVAYLPKMSLRHLAEVEEIQKEHSLRPEKRLAQRQLAFDVVSLVHSVEDAQKSERASDILFSSKAVGPVELEVLYLALTGSHLSQMIRTGPSDTFIGVKIVDLLSDGSLSKSTLHPSRSILIIYRCIAADYQDRWSLSERTKDD